MILLWFAFFTMQALVIHLRILHRDSLPSYVLLITSEKIQRLFIPKTRGSKILFLSQNLNVLIHVAAWCMNGILLPKNKTCISLDHYLYSFENLAKTYEHSAKLGWFRSCELLWGPTSAVEIDCQLSSVWTCSSCLAVNSHKALILTFQMMQTTSQKGQNNLYIPAANIKHARY